jgi:hypothetical protein
MYQPKSNEAVFKIRPVGVKYICEHCHEGEMKYSRNYVNFEIPKNNMFLHTCTVCGGELHLPKIYPYIEWISESEEGCNESSKTPNSD